MRLRTSVAALAALALLGACGEAPPTATSPAAPRFINNGTPTGGDYGNVGALLFDFDANGAIDGDDVACTGSLISPTVFLTAAHCVEFLPASAQLYVSFAPDMYARRINAIAATGFSYDPRYGHDQADLYDLAVVFLPAGSTRGVTPLKLPPAGYLDALAAQGKLSGQLFVNVGYGVSANRTGPPSFTYDGVRKSSKSEFMALQPAWLGLLMNTSATGEGGDCYGDSGGPKFLDGKPDMVVATVTTGDYPCRATTWDYRLDTESARSFLGQFVTLP
ncbi:MAG TPA: trypsin-like serine protease [Longimicrobiaceae bacterium]|nr:trypsin-like serine protease [Longimicrobiaceae bacterium]